MSQRNQQKQRSFGWGKVAGIIFATAIPAGILIYANAQVFPESAWMATGMVIATFGVACIFAVASGYATDKVRKYVLISAAVLSLELAANVAVHWVLARQVSGAKQATTARHEEEDREEKRRDADAKRKNEMLEKQTAVLNAEARRNDSARRLGIQAPRGAKLSAPAPAPSSEAVAAVTAATTTKPLTLEDVMDRWTPWLLALAVLDLLTSVVAFGICALLWEWDTNRDGIADHLQHTNETADTGQWVSRNGQDWVWTGPGEPVSPPPSLPKQ